MTTARRPPIIPRATYRLQFHSGFGFEQATALVPYLAGLGVSHIYASPFLMARPGSTHGYDITDHNHFNPEIGDEAAFERLITALRHHGMGLILDFVPNHMGVGGADSPWWLDVLEWGQASPFVDFFDIDWAPAEPSLKGKVLLPFLGDHYGNVLESGQLQLRLDGERGTFSVWYYGHRFPIAVRDYARLLRAARDRLSEPSEALTALIHDFARIGPGLRQVQKQAVLRHRADELKARLVALVAGQPTVRQAIGDAATALNGTPGDRRSFRDLHALLERQAYRVSYWRVATAEINYRRFFDINDLAGLKMENPDLFEVSHRLIFRLIAEDKIQGIRLDHVDGLYDPQDYFARLQDRAAYMVIQANGAAPPTAAPLSDADTWDAPQQTRSHPIYLLVEKILARHERLPDGWPVDGTTGYEFANLVNGLFVNAHAERQFSAVYHSFLRRTPDYEEIAVNAKRMIVTGSLASEINVLASDLHALAKQSWATRDYTLAGVTAALIEVVAHFPVYRTYIAKRRVAEEDRRYLDWAFSQARRAAGAVETSVFDFLYAVLTTDLLQTRGSGYRSGEVLRTAMKFQQVTGPVMAKAIEDTAFYRYVRLVSLNEVGGEPSRFGVSAAAFHRVNQDRARNHPYSMVATATHDHKRGEDVRARINALTEITAEWRRRVRRWAQLNARHKPTVDDQTGPSRNDEYLLYQTLVGTWPPDLLDPRHPGLKPFAERVAAYMTKAIREAKLRTSWSHANQAYETAVDQFVRRILDPVRSPAFLADIIPFQARIGVTGACNALAQTLLKLTTPGVPDIYQGTEYWDLSLVDPDNRRPVDYDDRQGSLATLEAVPPSGLVSSWRNGRVKQFLIARTLALRAMMPAVFSDGSYQPLEVTGGHSERVVALARRLGDTAVVVVVPRLTAPLLGDSQAPLPPASSWGATAVVTTGLPDRVPFVDVLTGSLVPASGPWRLADLLREFPVALLRTQDENGT